METLNAQQVAEMLGMAKRTFFFYRIMRRDPIFRLELEFHKSFSFWNKEEV